MLTMRYQAWRRRQADERWHAAEREFSAIRRALMDDPEGWAALGKLVQADADIGDYGVARGDWRGAQEHRPAE